jgi:two-component sensor histidine kinase
MLQIVGPATGRRPKPPGISVEDEAARLETVKRYDVLDTPPEEGLDRISATAADLLDAPISIISFVGPDSVYFKSRFGLQETKVARGPGSAAAALTPWLQTNFKNGFHIGASLRTPDGHELGKLSVVDRRPRRIDGQQVRRLKALAAIVMDRLDLRLREHKAAARTMALSREVDHRVTNSLQFIASVLNLQSQAVESPTSAKQLTAAANRVMAVARVHRAFCAHGTADRVPVVGYLRHLCGELSGILGAKIDVEGVEASVPKSQIQAIGLIVNELASNARKHGAGRITVTLLSTPDKQLELCVRDEGMGLPANHSAAQPGGIGMQVVEALASQLDGTFAFNFNPAGHPCGAGSCFSVTFPAA